MTHELIELLTDPTSGMALTENDDVLQCEGRNVARRIGDVWSFLEVENSFYEGAYLNRIRHVPKKDNTLHRLPFFFVANGYVWELCKHFAPGSRLLEMGCASGVDYLGQRYRMVGLDYSLTSLQGLNGYELRIQADAEHLPFADESLDGAISSYFWEHIEPSAKDRILQQLHRCIRPGGRLVFLYDMETSNGLIDMARTAAPEKYQTDFLDGDGHIGYETVDENTQHFESNGFRVVRHIGMERTWIQSVSAYKKLGDFPGLAGTIGKLARTASRGRLGNTLNMAVVRSADATFGRLWPIANSRILMTVAERVS